MEALLLSGRRFSGYGLIHDTASDKYYYALSDGSLVTGWLHLDQDYYYMNDDGALWTGWRTISGSRYYFYPESGKCALNVAMPIGDSWYLFGTDGKMQTGFQNVNESTYYFDRQRCHVCRNHPHHQRYFLHLQCKRNLYHPCGYRKLLTIGDEANNQNKKRKQPDHAGNQNRRRFPCCNCRIQQILDFQQQKRNISGLPIPMMFLLIVCFCTCDIPLLSALS